MQHLFVSKSCHSENELLPEVFVMHISLFVALVGRSVVILYHILLCNTSVCNRKVPATKECMGCKKLQQVDFG